MTPKNNLRLEAALERAEIYYRAHPRSPSAVRRPTISLRGVTWVALLGESVAEGIAGLGPNIETALRAFDVQYLNALRPPEAQLIPALRAPVRGSFQRAA
jgi:hypothetical protein